MATKLAEWEDLFRLPEDVRAEILAGRLVTSPPPLPEHGRAQASIGRFIGGPFDYDNDGPGGWWILTEVDVRLSRHDVVRPDVSGWRRERLAEPWGKRPVEVVPDWICEIISPSNADHDRVHKMELYAQHGVPHCWLIDPHERVLEAFALQGERWVRLGARGDAMVARIAPFEAVALEVGLLFPPRPSGPAGED